MSSTKPEVDNFLRCPERKTELRSQAACTENLVEFGHVNFEIRERTDKQANNTSHPGGEVIKL